MNYNKTNKEFKLAYKNVTKRFEVPKSFFHFKQIISQITEIEIGYIPTKFVITYNDNENDSILLTSDFDFYQAVNYMNVNNLQLLKFVVDEKRKDSCDFEFISKDELVDFKTETKQEVTSKVKTVEKKIVID